MITKAQIIDYLTTGLLASIPIIVAYQGQILPMIPPSYTVIAVIAFAALSQAAAGARVKAAKERVFGIVDEKQAQIEDLNRQIDAVQEKVDEEGVA